MRTTIELPDELFRKAKAAAALEGMSFKEYLTRTVRKALAEREARPEYGQHKPIPVSIPPAGRKIRSLTNAEIDEIFLREEMEEWDR